MDTKKVLISEFTYSEFLEYIEKTERVIGYDGIISKSSEREDSDFCGTETFQEAMNLARYGWESGIKELELEKELIVDGQMEFEHNIVGSTVDIGRFLSGAPDCMMHFIDRIERDKPELIIYTGLSYSAFNDQKEAQKYAKKILKIIVEANQKYSVKLVGVFSTVNYSKGDDILTAEFITIKDFYQQFVLNNLAFSYHPSFFRRLWFRFIETKNYRTSGYGKCMDDAKIKKLLITEKKDKTKSWYLPAFQHRGLKWSEADIFEF